MRPSAVRRKRNNVSPSAALEHAVSQAIAFLEQNQLAHGDFRTIAAADESLTRRCRPDSSLFVTALVLYAIGWSDDARVPGILERGLDFLAAEMEGPGVWRYWSSRNPHHNALPPDADDTSCIAYLLKKYARPLPANRALLLGNRDPQGRFYTWLTARHTLSSKLISNSLRGQLSRVSDPAVELVLSLSGTLDNMDCSVNTNVLLYLGASPETRGAIDYVVETVLQDNVNVQSTYYVHPLSFYYLLSRAYAGGVSALEKTRDTIVGRLETAQAKNGSFGNALLTALAACTLQNFHPNGSVLERAVRNLLACQNADGSWARHAMFLGPAPYYGSEELTTALCVEALARYQRSL